MEVHLNDPSLQAKINQWVAETGRVEDELVEDAMAGYFDELAHVRGMLDSRYDDLKSGRVKPIDGEAFFETLRQREEELQRGIQRALGDLEHVFAHLLDALGDGPAVLRFERDGAENQE